MNPDGTVDRYFRVWVGPDHNGQSIDERGTICCPPAGLSATLKFTTQLSDFTGDFGTVLPPAGNPENVADINDRVQRLRLSAERWVIDGTKYGFTAKGASDVQLTGLVEGFGKECDASFGNYSDQFPRGKTRAVLNLWREDRKTPIRIQCLQAFKPILVPGSGPYVFTFPNPDAWYHDPAIEVFLFCRRNRIAFT